MINAIANLLGYVIRFIYNICGGNYFWAIVIFTILTKLILFPLYLSQVKSNKEMKKIQPLYQKILEKYKNDKNKQAEEVTKLYAQHKINPLSGCLPLLIQFPIIIAMFYIVKQPLTYIQKLPQDQIVTYAKEYLQKDDLTFKQAKAYEINIAKKYELMDMSTIGNINLGDVPADVFSKDESKKANPVILLIPILSIVFSVVSNKLAQKSMEMTDEQKEMQKSMNLMMPLLSASVSYSTPIALGIYWLLGSILSVIQQFFTNKYINSDDENKKEKKNVLSLKGGK